MARREEEPDVRPERRRDDVHARLTERVEERRDVVGVVLHGRARRARRKKLPAKVATDDAVSRRKTPRDGLPRRERHHSAVQKDERGTLAIHAVRQHAPGGAHRGASEEEEEEEDFFET